MAIRKGSKIQQIMPAPFEGECVGFRVDDETGDTLLLVERIVVVDGEEHRDQRAFKRSEVVELPPV